MVVFVAVVFGVLAFFQFQQEPRCSVSPTHQVVRFSPEEGNVNVELSITAAYDATITSIDSCCSCLSLPSAPITIKKGETKTVCISVKTNKFHASTEKSYFVNLIPLPVHTPVATVQFAMIKSEGS